MDIEAKKSLREEAKSLLLKGCYKMSMNKYIKLIQEGADGFTQRQWSVIHLNLGITNLMQQRLPQALQSINQSITIDKNYDKAYFRKVQVLYEMGEYQAAMECVPTFAINAEIQTLQNTIKQEYKNNLGIQHLIQQVKKGNISNKLLQSINEGLHSKLIQKCEENNLSQCSTKLAEYYLLLRSKNSQLVDSLMKSVHSLALSNISAILTHFWKQYLEIIDSGKQLTAEQYKVMCLCPAIIYGQSKFTFLLKTLKQIDIEQMEKYILANITAYQSIPPQQQQEYIITYDTIDFYIDIYAHQLSNQVDNWNIIQSQPLERIINWLIKLMTIIYPTHQSQLSLKTCGELIKFCYRVKSQQMIQKNAVETFNKYIIEAINQNNIFKIYNIQRIIKYLAKDINNQCIQSIKNKINEHFQTTENYGKTQILYINLLLKINSNEAKNIHINPSILNKILSTQSQQNSQPIEFAQIEHVIMLSVHNVNNLHKLLKHSDDEILELVGYLLNKIKHINQQYTHHQINQLELSLLVINFVYILVTDLEDQSQKAIAQKIGTSAEQVHNARLLQGQANEPKINNEIKNKRQKLSKLFSIKLIDQLKIIIDVLAHYPNIQSILNSKIQLTKIFNTLSTYNQKIYHKSILEFIISVYNQLPNESKYKLIVVRFLSTILKKCNPQMLPYVLLQNIVNILLWGVSNADHQLTIFECLLSLGNLSALSNSGLIIDTQKVMKGLFEQNQYIVHATLQLINNILIYESNEQGGFKHISESRIGKIRQIVIKYLDYYRDIISNQQKVQIQQLFTDYAHPYRIFGTLISICLVLQIPGIPEIQNISSAKQIIKKMYNKKQGNNNKDLSIMMFKIFTSASNRQYLQQLKLQMNQNYLTDLFNILEIADKQKWIKLKQLMR